MTLDAGGFRELLGVAPGGRVAVLEALLAGDSSVEDLVLASGLPRRDVEEFTAALPADYEKLLAEYRASRVRVRAEDESGLERVAADLIRSAPAPRKRFDHVQAIPATLVDRVRWLTERFDLSGRRVLFAGDHDLTSLLLARVVPDAELAVADIDEDLLGYIDSASSGRVRGVWADFRHGLPPFLAEWADVVFTDPPYTPEGLGLFLARSVQALSRRDPGARIAVAYGHSRRRPDLGLAAQREILRHDLVIDAMLPAFSRYTGAQAVGSASDLYCLQPAPSAFRRAGSVSAQGIYTHGEHSVESGASRASDLIPLLAQLVASGTGDPAAVGLISPEPGTARGFAVTVSFGKLLTDGVHPSVTGRAEEFVADLRDDPGPWLLRAMLALNAPRAVFAVDARHGAVAGPESSDDLLRAKYSPMSQVAVGDLVAVRCELAPRAPGDAGLELARFVTRRAHGRLRNVWREGLVHLSGGTLTKREAAALADETAAAAGIAADLALRLIDVPAHRFPALHAAFRASAGAVG